MHKMAKNVTHINLETQRRGEVINSVIRTANFHSHVKCPVAIGFLQQ